MRPKFSTILLCIALFFLFLLLRFPYGNLRGYIFGKIFENTRIFITADDIYPALLGWPGLGAHNVSVTIPVGDGELDLNCEKATFKVGLGGLIPPVPSVSLNMRNLKKGGDAYVKLSQSGSRVKTSIEADDVELEQLKYSLLPKAILGTLNATSDLDFDINDLSKTNGDVDLDIKKLKLPPFPVPSFAFIIPPMTVNNMKGKIRIRNGVVEFQNFAFGDATSDLRGSIAGEVKLGSTLAASSMNIVMRIELSDRIKTNSQSETLLSFLKTFMNAKGGYGIKCNKGFLDIASCLLVPEKVD